MVFENLQAKHLSHHALAAIAACVEHFQPLVSKLVFSNCEVDSKGALVIKLILADDSRSITTCDFS